MRSLLALSLLAALACGPAAWAGPSESASLKKAVRKALDERDPRARASALGKALRGADGEDAAKTIARMVLADEQPAIVKNIAAVSLGRMKSNDALPALRALAADGDLEQRVHVVRAIGRSQVPGATDVLEEIAGGQKGVVRTAALAAIAERGDDAAAATALRALEDERWESRAAAIQALGAFKQKKHVPLLCDAMKKLRSGRLVDDYAEALERVTGQTYGADPDRYLSWFAGKGGKVPPEPWEPPDYTFESALVATRSQRILFVLSRTVSMGDEVDGASHPAEVIAMTADVGEDLALDLQAAATKLEVARVHLRTMIRSLADGVRFDVLTYSSPDFVFGKLVESTTRTRKKAETRISGLSASGDADIYRALRRAFDPRAKDPLVVRDGPDTIVLLTDGNLQEPYTTDREEIQRAVQHWKRARQIVIHVAAVGTSVHKLLGPLAQGAPAGGYVTVP